MHWRRKWQPTPVFLPGESQGRQRRVGCRLWGRTESDTTEVTQQQQQQQQLYSQGVVAFYFPGGASGKESERTSLVVQMVKRLPATRETRVRSLGQEDPLEKEMATHSSTLA